MSVDLDILSREMRTRFYSLEEQLELGRRFKEEGDVEAGDELVRSHRPMVLELAKKLYYKARYAGLDIFDLISAGDEGLVVARDSYDYRKGVKYTTYARYAIITHMDKIIKLGYKHAREFDSELVEDTPDRSKNVDLELIEYIRRDDNKRIPRGELFDYLLENSGLDKRQRRIIVLRFADGKTLVETAEELYREGYKRNGGALTKERIRQIQEQALRRIKKTHMKLEKVSV